MSKPQPTRIASDDCAVTVDGVACYPHEGEWVELYRLQSVAELQAMEQMTRLTVALQAAQGEPDEAQRSLAIMNAAFGDACACLAGRVVAWNWTDLSGAPLPPPAGNPAVLARLSVEEVSWLLARNAAETAGERKNGSAPSPTTSSATASTATGASRSITARSRSRA